MQTVDELKYSQSVWGFQPRKAEIRRVCDVKGLLRNRNQLDVGKDRFRQRCQIVPLVRKTLKCPDCGKQAYGFRDFKYFRLKIFDLPSTDIRKRL